MSRFFPKSLWFLTLSALLSLSTGCLKSNASTKSKPFRVVIHINSANPKVQQGALRNVQNILKEVGPEKADIRVLLHSGGVTMVLLPDAAQRTLFKKGHADNKRQALLRKLRKLGVRFHVCANTLRSKKTDRARDLFEVPAKDIVPSGVVALIKFQQAGYAYVKP
ncbi:MAG: DsrE family protein [Myxococcales bacterium]|nr:DsrE family protein [Myxococcales bacterium]